MRKRGKKAGRRLNHEGSVSERKDGLNQASIMVNGKRIYFYSRDKAECYRWLDELKVKEYQGIPITSGDITLNELTQSYERDRVNDLDLPDEPPLSSDTYP